MTDRVPGPVCAHGTPLGQHCPMCFPVPEKQEKCIGCKLDHYCPVHGKEREPVDDMTCPECGKYRGPDTVELHEACLCKSVREPVQPQEQERAIRMMQEAQKVPGIVVSGPEVEKGKGLPVLQEPVTVSSEVATCPNTPDCGCGATTCEAVPVPAERVCRSCGRVHGKDGWNPRHIPVYNESPEQENRYPGTELTIEGYREHCAKLRKERDALRAENERLRHWNTELLERAHTAEGALLRRESEDADA